MRQQYFSPMTGNVIFEHIFFCSCIYDPIKGALKQLPANIKLSSSKSTGNQKGKFLVDEVENAKRKGKAVSGDQPTEKTSETSNDCRLSTLDIFAGCGGLSEGLEKSGACFTKWAIEYEEPAAEAFKLNHPEAEVFCQNCNVILSDSLYEQLLQQNRDFNCALKSYRFWLLMIFMYVCGHKVTIPCSYLY
ncbi:DNA (cytosine-5)-methyltransferase 1B-like [Cryptomeria japonica]|uniref:DNA (cytosine-5)-methyltransferase 1B-like n=1 Tax=Cryptomeria japonica TaxID=3369 RepID=UPI0027DA631B|nr:DNA (cytosine-5)-methyltransferase 1B-like [Cryptomeria japonica]